MKIHGVEQCLGKPGFRDFTRSSVGCKPRRAARNYNIYPFNLRARERKERRAEALSIRALTRRCTFVSSPSATYDDKLAR